MMKPLHLGMGSMSKYTGIKHKIQRRERENDLWQKYLIMTGRELNYADVLMNLTQAMKCAQMAGYVQDGI